MHAPHGTLCPAHHVSFPSLSPPVPLDLCRLHPEELGGPPLKKLKQEVDFLGCT